MKNETLTDIYIALKDLHYFTNFVQSKEVTRKDIEEQAYLYHVKYEQLITDFRNTLEQSMGTIVEVIH